MSNSFANLFEYIWVLLAVVFITLKLLEVTAVATWSWWWVLALLWIPTVLVVGVLLIMLMFALIFGKK